MNSTRRSILLKHYQSLLRKSVSVVGLVSILALMLPGAAMATGQLTTRSVTLGTSDPGATTTYAVSFKAATASSIKAIQIQLCTSPLDLGTGGNCTQPGTGSLAGSTLTAQGGGLSGWAMGNGTTTCAAPAATIDVICLAAGLTPSVGQVETFTLSGVVNPNTANDQYYLRFSSWATYTTASVTTEIDFGGDAVSTGTELTVAANVQESLQFTVGSTNCTTGAGPVNVGSGANNVLTSGTTTGSNSYECVNTNAASGYALSYLSSNASAPCPNGGTTGSFTNCTGTTHDFYQTASATDFNTATTAATDHDFYGINLALNTGSTNGDAAALPGAAPSGGAAPTVPAAYSTADKFAWTPNAVTSLATEPGGPTATETFTTTYEAQAGSLTPAGQYKVNIDYICTSTY